MTDENGTEAPASAEQTPEPASLHGCPLGSSRGQTVLHVPRERYVEVAKALVDDGFTMCVDLTGVDYLSYDTDRGLPESVTPERFEVVLNLLSLGRRERLRVRVQVPEHDASLPTMFDLWPGTEAMEREVYDMFGITFDGHPDPSRILMPEDWDGHPLRKDYEVGRIPVQFSANFPARGGEAS